MGNLTTTIFRCRRHQVIVLGLDNSGKSTIVYQLKLKHFVQQAPTIGFNCEKFRIKNGAAKGQYFTVWDIGGQEKLRPLWKTYLRHASVLVFVVDSTDQERFDEAGVEIGSLMRFANLPNNVPIVLLANKQDLPEAKCCDLVRDTVACNVGKHLLRVQPCCAITGEGLDDFFGELYQLIVEAK
ncbi:unnamed protein product [Enterobius vermicularis]|uniref:ADP-ribosylation factor-like protein 6 n=1 Tax=Enterobius vermicularis TaxID=51028 RepID=A0A0N4VJY3_ENTVE|nr:unnamed protein product [Enterobius vermicularis]